MTDKMLMCLFGVLLSARITIQAASPTSQFYTGAVVEYYPVRNGTDGEAIANENAQNYLKFLSKANEHDVDIIVFPEGSLTASEKSILSAERIRHVLRSSYVPDPKDLETPCKNDSSIVMKALKAISCGAKQHAMYVVVNVREKEKCTSDEKTGCSADGYNLYNTNVVFDRKGTVIARYRKTHLFGENMFNVTSKPELSTFTTDFNVTFGQIICFDIIFDRPALQLVRDAKVTDILFSSNWFSELPFLTSREVQSGWSYANNVNFLGSGTNNPASGSGGSGIYAGSNGSLVSFWSEKRVNALLISRIPKVIKSQRNLRDTSNSMTYIFPTNDMPTIDGPEPVSQQRILNDDLEPYTTEIFPPTNGSYSITLCDRGLCCDFTTGTTYIEPASPDNNARYYRYRFAVFNGIRSFSTFATGGIEVCGIISCTDDSDASCGKRFDTNEIIVHPVTFNSLVISGNFTSGPNAFRMPIGLNTDIQPLNVTDFSFTSTNLNKTHVNVKYSLRQSRKGLMTFGIWGRNFTADGGAKTTRSSATQSTPFVFTLVMLTISGIGSAYAIGPLAIAA